MRESERERERERVRGEGTLSLVSTYGFWCKKKRNKKEGTNISDITKEVET